MSELKAYKPYANRDGDVLIYHKGDGDLMLDDEDEIYLKEDADKVIAHHKHKRCLAMAKFCEDEAEINHNSAYEASEYLPSREDYFSRSAEHYERWQKRWLELAEKFKEAE